MWISRGSVAFPVMVDPIILGYYGVLNGASTWAGWTSADSCGGCFSLYGGANYRVALVNPGAPNGAYGQWYIYAPKAGQTGGAGITRVDLRGVRHSGNNETTFAANIGESNGSNPVWTYNGTAGAQGTSPLVTGGSVSESIAFCAQGAGGYDGGAQPLCNENNVGKYFTNQLQVGPGALNEYGFYEFTGAAIRYVDTTAPNITFFENLPHGWYQYGTKSLRIVGWDQGVGVAAFSLEIPPGHVNPETGQPVFAENLPCDAENGFDGCPEGTESKNIDLSGLATGIYTLGGYVYDAVGNVREITEGAKNEDPKIYVDHTAPTLSLNGPLAEANGKSIGEGATTLNFTTQDGSTAAPQVGMSSVSTYVDGVKVNEQKSGCSFPSGVPVEECFTLNGSWTFEGQAYGAGQHTVTVVARDYLSNESSSSVHFTVNSAGSQPVGPGAVNLKTGAYTLAATDVSIAAADSNLTVTRSYNSRAPWQGYQGPLGGQWQMSLPDPQANGVWQSVRAMPTGSVSATTVSGALVTFESSGGGKFSSPAGYQSLTLSETSKSPLEYRMTDTSGNSTIFTRASTSSEEAPLLVPSGVVQATGAGGLNKMAYTFTKTSEGVVEPTEIAAPFPTSIKCVVPHAEELVAGCRALTFNYASSTTATGEGPSQWGDYKGRLTRVYFTAWNPTSKAMATTTVAQYSYDTQGRLRAEWDPRVSPALKVEYGYDSEGHVTALTGAGQETWAFTYGAIMGDPSTGRLLKAYQAPAGTALWAGEGLAATEAPQLSGTVEVGSRVLASAGKWSGSPIT